MLHGGEDSEAKVMASKSCWFCGRDDAAFHKEDIFPKWSASLEPVSAMVSSDTFKVLPDSPVEFQSRPRGQSTKMVTREICQPCNNGWMSQLESEAKPILLLMNEGKAMLLTPGQMRTVSRWAIKTAYVHEAANGTGVTSPFMQRRKFFEDPFWKDGLYRVLATRAKNPSRKLGRSTAVGIEGYPNLIISSFYIQLSHLVFQVWIRSTGGPYFTPSLVMDGLAELWPVPRGRVLSWPPRKVLNPRELKALELTALALVSERVRARINNEVPENLE